MAPHLPPGWAETHSEERLQSTQKSLRAKPEPSGALFESIARAESPGPAPEDAGNDQDGRLKISSVCNTREQR